MKSKPLRSRMGWPPYTVVFQMWPALFFYRLGIVTDDMTLDCLEEQGFCVVCAGDTVMPQRRGSLLLVPSLMAPRYLVDYIVIIPCRI